MTQSPCPSQVQPHNSYSPLGWVTIAPLQIPYPEIPPDIIQDFYAGLACYVYVPKEICPASIQIHQQPHSFPGMSFIAYIEVKIPKPSTVESAISIIILNYNARSPTYPLPSSPSLFSLYTHTKTTSKKIMEELKPTFQLLTKNSAVYLVPKRDSQIVRPKLNIIRRISSLQHETYYVFRVPTNSMSFQSMIHTPSSRLRTMSSYGQQVNRLNPYAGLTAFGITASTLSTETRGALEDVASNDRDGNIIGHVDFRTEPPPLRLFNPSTFVDSEGKQLCVALRSSPDVFVGSLHKRACLAFNVPASKWSIRLFTHPEIDADVFTTLLAHNRRRFVIVSKEGKQDPSFFLHVKGLIERERRKREESGESLRQGEALSFEDDLLIQGLFQAQEEYESDADIVQLDEDQQDVTIPGNGCSEGLTGFFRAKVRVDGQTREGQEDGKENPEDAEPSYRILEKTGCVSGVGMNASSVDPLDEETF
ncbi:hypothetical protein BLNAU_13064 [Blattamonas nauphoetae]|uniref:Uncharacterized protein n=1 Tax=Blattamonas nauphoetae TaxID=2049346 RepID=A0ABQ9XJQ4_9EUKA|nr:hypothetical protein BLNAU_13064 [Blattamonas nauphoetae]